MSSERGLGSLRIENGTKRDAVAALFGVASTEAAGDVQRAIYVRAGDTATMQEIAPGTYALRFSLGLDWEETANRFAVSPTYSEFVDPFQFTETRVGDKIVYSQHHVTLHPVPNGTAHTQKIDPSSFNLSKLVRVSGGG